MYSLRPARASDLINRTLLNRLLAELDRVIISRADIIATREAARMLEIDASTVRRHVLDGNLHWVVPGYLDRREVLDFLALRKARAAKRATRATSRASD